MNADNQQEYWDKVADLKTFSHPVSTSLLKKYLHVDATIIDFGCGYGRIIEELLNAGFSNLNGYDSSINLVTRGQREQLPVHYIASPRDLPLDEESVDCILLIAVLTCIPSNEGQKELVKLLHSKLKHGGFIYVSDYYLQDNDISRSRYTVYNNDPTNFGVFHLPEGAIFRHHTREWITTLFEGWQVTEEQNIQLKTMNGNNAAAFQLIATKPL